MKSQMYAPGVEFDAGVGGDHYLGSVQALISAGVIQVEHIPSATSVTFFEGVQVDGRAVKAKQDERWMNIRFVGRNLRVTKGIADAERFRREEQREREAEELARTTPSKDPGFDAIRALEYKASAAFLVNEEVFVYGSPATVTGELTLRRVRDEDGQYIDGESRADYQPGYTCRLRQTGEESSTRHMLCEQMPQCKGIFG